METLCISDVEDGIEARMLEAPQVECPVVHHFGPGVYIREVTMPAGAFVLGHRHKFLHTNILIQGKLKFMCEDGVVREFSAPMVMQGKPGRKLAYILEDTIWQNVYATDETDVEKLEEMLLDKSEAWHLHEEQLLKLEESSANADREDFSALLDEFGLSEGFVWGVSESEDDQIPMPHNQGIGLCIRHSPIHGSGIFTGVSFKAFDVLAPARLGGKRTPVGRFANHSRNPNCFMAKNDQGDIYLLALRDITGAVGGSSGEELTVDYRQALRCSQSLE